MKIEIMKPVNIKGKRYEVDSEYKPTKEDMPLINRLNEKGYIKPLTKDELLEISNSFLIPKNKKSNKKEE